MVKHVGLGASDNIVGYVYYSHTLMMKITIFHIHRITLTHTDISILT